MDTPLPPADLFVGRSSELSQLSGLVNAVSDGEGQLVLVVGEAGIGKSRLAEAVAELATTKDFSVAWGRCRQQQGMPGFWPWIELLSHASDGSESPSDIRSVLSNATSASTSGAADTKYQLFHELSSSVRSLGGEQATLLILDDLHWADESSIEFLEYLAPELSGHRLMILGTYRESDLRRGHPLSRALGSLARERCFTRLPLSGVDESGTEQLISSIIATDLPAETVAEVHGRANGNPFFVIELAQLLREELGNQTNGSALDVALGVPAGVREVIGRRLEFLSPDCLSMLHMAALIGGEFSLRQLGAVITDLDQAQLLDAVEEAAEASALQEAPGVGAYRFGHALVADALVDDLSGTQKLRLQASLATRVESFWGDNATAHALELSEYFAAAEPLLGPDPVIKYSLLAAHQSAASYAWHSALEQCERALLACEMAGGAESATGALPAIHEELARVHGALGDSDKALEAIETAFDLYMARHQHDDALRIAADSEVTCSSIVNRALSLVERASHDEGRLLAWRGFFEGMQGDDESSEEAFDDAAAIAQREGDQQLELQVLTNSGLVDSSAGRSGPDVIRRAERVVDFASRLGDVSTEFRSREWAALNFLREGLPNQAREHLEACEEIAERLDYLPFRIDIFRLASVIEMCRGNMDGVRHAIEQFPVAINFALPRARQIEVELITGEIESASGKLRQLIRDVQRGVTRDARSPVAGEMAALVSLSGFASRLGVEDAPVDTVQRISERVLSGAAPPVPTLVAHFGNAMLGGYEEDEAALGDLLVGISPFKGKFSVPYPHVDRILGTLEAMSGNHDAAQALFKSSMSFAESANYPLEVAMTCLDEATAAIRHNSNADRKRVEALISKGVAISDANGLFGVVKQFDAIRDGAAQLGQTRPTYPDGLSSREVEVLVELAKGKLNREIGESLFITENTVIRHVSNIFTKTGVANRGEAGAYAVRQGIAGEVEESK